LGVISPNGRLFTLSSVFKIKEVAQIFGLLFPRCQLCINFDKKGWATFWATFSQAHLVTLTTFHQNECLLQLNTEHMLRYFLEDFRLSGKTFIPNSNVCTYVRKVRRPTLEEESLGQRSPDQTPICR
jgi:hypothetical protein